MSSLHEYHRKRRFDVTAEPKGRRGESRQARLRFVVQKHRARRLHYDFRLEWDGVLLSWAVPKGPSVDPSVKRLAMMVEDHPLEYAGFEGIIPEGEYGGGTVMLWDKGTWTPESPDVGEALRKGSLKFALRGKKLGGSWALVRTHSRQYDGDRAWLLIKHGDDHADRKRDITEEEPRSVKSKRLLAEIAIEEGGDVEKAASGDPADEIRALIKALPKKKLRRKRQPSVWRTNGG